jgi:hypothetical protein
MKADTKGALTSFDHANDTCWDFKQRAAIRKSLPSAKG